LILGLGNRKHGNQKIVVKIEIGKHGAQASDLFASIDGVSVHKQDIYIRSPSSFTASF